MMAITAAIIAAGRAVEWAIGHRAMYAFLPDLTYNSTGRWRGGARGRLVFLFFITGKKYIYKNNKNAYGVRVSSISSSSCSSTQWQYQY